VGRNYVRECLCVGTKEKEFRPPHVRRLDGSQATGVTASLHSLWVLQRMIGNKPVWTQCYVNIGAEGDIKQLFLALILFNFFPYVLF
jgi:hypothetical protein